jgi:hypothetical protein
MRAQFRLARAAVVGGTTVFLAAAAHVVGGGALPDPLVVVGILVLTLVPTIALAGRKISAVGMLGMLGAGQLGLHVSFDALSVSAASAPPPSASHVHVLTALSTPSASEHLHADSALMLVGHILATVATALVLARGEQALWALLAWLTPLVRLLATVSLHPAPALPAFSTEPLTPAWRSLRLPARRGPPSSPAVP